MDSRINKKGLSHRIDYQMIAPQEGPQTAFLRTSADICFYGGAA